MIITTVATTALAVAKTGIIIGARCYAGYKIGKFIAEDLDKLIDKVNEKRKAS